MALPDLTGQNIQDTYQRVLQTDGGTLRDGTGSLVTPTSTKYIVSQSSFTDGLRFTRSGHDSYRMTLGDSEGLQIYNETNGVKELRFDGAGNAAFAGDISASGQFLGSNFGLDSTDKLQFSDATLQFRLNDSSRITHTPTIFRPTSDEGVSLGRSNEKWKELVVNHITASGDISGSGNIYGTSANFPGLSADSSVVLNLGQKSDAPSSPLVQVYTDDQGDDDLEFHVSRFLSEVKFTHTSQSSGADRIKSVDIKGSYLDGGSIEIYGKGGLGGVKTTIGTSINTTGNITASGDISSSIESTGSFGRLICTSISASTGQFDANTISLGGTTFSKAELDNLKLGRSINTNAKDLGGGDSATNIISPSGIIHPNDDSTYTKFTTTGRIGTFISGVLFSDFNLNGSNNYIRFGDGDTDLNFSGSINNATIDGGTF